MARQSREERQKSLAAFFAANPDMETRFLSVFERIESNLYELGEDVVSLKKEIANLRMQIYLSGGGTTSPK